MLKPFNADILLYDPYINEQQAQDLGVKKVSMDELMSTSDMVTVHAPNLPSTHHLVNKDNLALMKDGAILINTSRGPIIDEMGKLRFIQLKV